MNDGELHPLADTIKSVLDRIQTVDDDALERPVCPVKNPLCDGYGVVVEEDGSARKCDCVLKARRDADVSMADVPRRYVKAELESFEPRTPLAKAALVIAREFVESFDPEEGRGLYIHGGTGVGKTHLAVAVLKALLAKDLEAAFFGVTDLLDQMRRTMDPTNPGATAGALAERLKRPVVVLDNLGMQKTSAWVDDRLYAIINTAYEDCRTLIVTSPDSPAELQQKMEPPVFSRLMGMCEEIEIAGGDARARASSAKRGATRSRKKTPAQPGVSVEAAFKKKSE